MEQPTNQNSDIENRNFALQKGAGFWEVTYAGQRAVLRHEAGLEYVAWLLAHPNESIHALDLASRVSTARGKQKHHGLTEIEDPATGKMVPVQSGSRIQERGLFLDDARAMRAALRRQAVLESYVEDENTTDAEREEAYKELAALYEFEKHKSKRVRDAAGKASDAVCRAITRLTQRLAKTVAEGGQPHPVLRPFGRHIRERILLPSGRGANGGVRTEGEGGFFVCQTAGE